MNLNLIPLPKQMRTDEAVRVKPDFHTVHADLLLLPAVSAVGEYAQKAGIYGDMPISLVYDAGLDAEWFIVNVTADEITVRASDVTGAQHGLAILLQLASDGEVSGCTLAYAPDCPYRGVMIDLARNWHPVSFLFEYVDLCWLYGIGTLHLHFTDDQSYTLPSRLFPKIPTAGRSYTYEEMTALDRYAASRGVQLMPEIDVPGHCSSFQLAYGDIFGTDGIIAQTETSMNAMKALFGELCDMFPHSEMIHIGGDEAAIMKWTENPACRDYVIANGIDFDTEDKTYLSERMLAHFVQTMADAVMEHGRTAAAWEGFHTCVNEFVSRDIIMMSWENYYQTTYELLDADFDIINASWNPMYVVTPTAYWSLEEVYDWSIYRWRPIHPQSPYIGKCIEIEPDERVMGGQLLAWGDAIGSSYPTVQEGIREEQRLVEERAAILSEHTWNVEPTQTAEEYISALRHRMVLLQKIK